MPNTLATLKAQIADDLERDDLTAQIATAISSAIEFYQSDRFYFTETRSTTFPTVAGQSRYTSADNASIPKFVTLDEVFLEDSSGNSFPLDRSADPEDLEWRLATGAGSGRPIEYAYFAQGFWFYPIPDAVYTIRPMGVLKFDAPATDGEANNVWMTEAFELIRCAAKLYIAMHTIVDPDLAARSKGGETRALARLRTETGRKIGSGRIIPTDF